MKHEEAKVQIAEIVETFLRAEVVATQQARSKIARIAAATLQDSTSMDHLRASFIDLENFVKELEEKQSPTIFLAYKQGEVKPFATEEEARKFSTLVEASAGTWDVSQLRLRDVILAEYHRAKEVVMINSRGFGRIQPEIFGFLVEYVDEDNTYEALESLLDLIDEYRRKI